MKKSVLVLLSAIALVGSVSLNAQTGWQQVNTSIIESLNSVYITSYGHIFIGSEQGNIFRSTDGGNTWTPTVTGVTDGIADITFTTDSDAWAVGDDGMILNSTDSGSTWSPVMSGVSPNLESIFFANANTAYIAGRDGVILKSVNGGLSWSQQTSGSTDRLESVYFISASTGFVAGRDGAFLETSDGGASWTSATSLGSDDNKAVYFLDTNTGFVGGENGIFKTTNGGQSWNNTTIPGNFEVEALHFGSVTNGYVVGEMGLIGKSVDGGDNWTVDTIFGVVEFNDVYFTDGANGMAVGNGGTILRHTGTPASNFCAASYWVDTANSGGSNVYVINNSVPSNSNGAYTNTYYWDFGDGNSSSQAFPSHTYANSGSYEVCVTITSTDAASNFCMDTYCDTLGLDSLGNLIYKNAITGFTLNVVDSSFVPPVSIDENALLQVQVYPNPATDQLQVRLPLSAGAAYLEIFNGIGQLVKTEEIRNDQPVDVSSLGRGIYFLNVSDEDHMIYSTSLILK